MELTHDQLGLIRARVRNKLGEPDAIKEPDLSRKGLALCVIDSVQSTGVRYASVVTVLKRYINYRADQGADAYVDGMAELLKTFDDVGGAEAWASDIGNGHKTSTRPNAPLKSVAVKWEAELLSNLGIQSRADLQQLARDPERLETVATAWRSAVGQRSGISWRYVLMLAGVPGVKPDRMIRRFVAEALRVPFKTVGIDFAADAVNATADSFGISRTALDHAMWGWQRLPQRLRS